jgi:hypothetical protein
MNSLDEIKHLLLRWLLKLPPAELWPLVVWYNFTDVSQECAASISGYKNT